MRTAHDSALPPRTGLRRLINPWEYRHLQATANVRFASGGFQLGVGLCLVGIASKAETEQERRKLYRLSAWFLVPAALNLVGGFVDVIAARPGPPET
jgi:hypothetical protein